MAKVFSGKEFLANKAVKVDFTNGVVATVNEISDKAMASMESLGKNDESGLKEIREVVALMCGEDASKLAGIGIVELRGVMDFLSENLFG